MENRICAALLAIAVLTAAGPAAFAAGSGPFEAAKDSPRVASAKIPPAPTAVRPAPSDAVPGIIGEFPAAPAGRAADPIAEYYASGKMRVR